MKNKIIMEPKDKPTIRRFRTWLAFRLVDVANWVRPGNEAATAYMASLIQESMLEEMLYGRSEIEIKVRKGGRKA